MAKQQVIKITVKFNAHDNRATRNQLKYKAPIFKTLFNLHSQVIAQ